MTDEKPKIYHERQKLQLCALHSLNNLFQENHFTKRTLDSIVNEYDKSWCWNEYSTLFTGNYDLTIIIEALKRRGYTLRAIDRDESFNIINFNDCLGLLLNVTIPRPFFDRLPVVRSLTKPGRHWLTIRSIGKEQYYDFDSKLSQPKFIGNQTNLRDYLNELDRTETYIYMVMKGPSAQEI